ncbi:MAG TPA: ATP-dependent DNA helicase RecG [Spirochaetia bacterium]|nr:ATP-dependent DNA helicase RecG [Spirochaetia bacterium]
MYLSELSTPVAHLKGVGPAVQADLKNLGIITVRDLLLHLPRDFEDRTHVTPLSAAFSAASSSTATPAQINTVAYVEGHEFIGGGRNRTLKVRVRDESASAYLVCFGRNFLANKLAPGTKIYLAGPFSYRYGQLQSASFDFEPWSQEPGRFSGIMPIYPLSGRLAQPLLRKLILQALRQYANNLGDEIPADFRTRRSLPDLPAALQSAHLPLSLEAAVSAREALAYYELFLLQFAAGRRAVERKKDLRTRNLILPGATAATGRLQKRIMARLPFDLTEDQLRVVESHRAALARGDRVAMLLQGEVGSGKTLVGFLMCLPYVENGFQVVFMAPTELLARQHAESAARIIEPAGVRLAFLSGGLKGAARERLLSALAKGEIDLLIGTHAVFTGTVVFKDLRFVIVDEQHRFGVAEREAIMSKGNDPDSVMMSATPIPRTLALTVFGDLDLEEIRTMPKGRKQVQTHLARQGNEQKVYDWVRREILAHHQAYFVYPLIEQSEKLDLLDAESMYANLKHILPDARIGIIHSRVPEEDKLNTMELFENGKLDVLVATSVVEVGVDVPNATCMVIEHAERFGLAALHQLRGRVGRGNAQSYAFLVYSDALTDEGKQRLKIMLNENDGFRIAEEDLKLRGPGDIAGVQQSGYLRLRVADLSRDMQLMLLAREDAFELLAADPGLLLPENAALRTVEPLLQKIGDFAP